MTTIQRKPCPDPIGRLPLSADAPDSAIVQALVPILETIPGHCALLSDTGKILLVNEEWRLFGQANAASTAANNPVFGAGANYLSICEAAEGACSQEAARVAKGLRQVLDGELARFECEYPCHAPDEARWFKCAIKRFPDQSLYQNLTLVQHVNVTQQVQWQATVLDYKSNLDAFLDSTPSGVWLVDYARDRIVLDSKTSALLLDNAMLEMGFEALLEMADPEDREGLRQSVKGLVARRVATSENTLRLTNTNGEEKLYTIFMSLIASSPSKPILIQALYVDRTGELAQNLSQQKFDREICSFIEHMPIRFSKLDRKLRYIFVNDEFIKMTGIQKSEAIGMHPSDALGESGWIQVQSKMACALSGQTAKVELDFILPNGSRFQGLAVYIPARGYSGKIEGIYALVQDLTELKTRERETREALKRAEQANLERSNFFAAMNHDLRTPLNAILGLSEMIKLQAFGPIETPKYLEYANDIHGSATILLDLINTAIDFNQIGFRGVELHKEWLSVTEILESAYRVLNPAAVARDTTLNVYTDICGLVFADALSLQKILLNLIGNAIKFTEGGAITVAAQESSGALIIYVEDTGVGMTGEQLATCRDPYKTSADPTFKNDGGWGLGLAIVDKLVQEHHGDFDIESTVGRGTKVTIALPVSPTH